MPILLSARWHEQGSLVAGGEKTSMPMFVELTNLGTQLVDDSVNATIVPHILVSTSDNIHAARPVEKETIAS